MSKWKNIANAPKDRTIMLWGHIDPKTKFELLTWERPSIFVGYWDPIDCAWVPVGGTWLGPFMKCYYWQELPQPPNLTVK